MAPVNEEDYENDDQDIEILVDTLRQCFLADKARYYVAGHQNTLSVEIEGLDELNEDEITEVADPILEELDLDFDEILLVPLKS